MKISIITVCRNSELTIRDCIESVIAQNHHDIEYIVVDGASTDGTMRVIREYSEYISSMVSQPDKGIYDAMNKGLGIATGDVIGFLNSDDFYQDNSVLSEVIDCFQRSPRSDLVIGDVVFVQPDNLERVVRYYSSAGFKPWKLRFGFMPPHPATFITREAYQRVGCYSLGYQISADYEMFVRLLLLHNSAVTRIDNVLVKMRVGGVSTSGLRNSIRLNMEIVRACRENGVYTNLIFILSKIPFKLLELLPGLRTKKQ
ncbi:MAG: glycosyltransferase family 2 protein [Oceanicoccus sp.]